jgi:hypothetical protein
VPHASDAHPLRSFLTAATCAPPNTNCSAPSAIGLLLPRPTASPLLRHPATRESRLCLPLFPPHPPFQARVSVSLAGSCYLPRPFSPHAPHPTHSLRPLSTRSRTLCHPAILPPLALPTPPPPASRPSSPAYARQPPPSRLPPIPPRPAYAPNLRCFDYMNGQTDLVVGYMGAVCDGRSDHHNLLTPSITIIHPRLAPFSALSPHPTPFFPPQLLRLHQRLG